MGKKFLHDEGGKSNDDVWVVIIIFLIVAGLIIYYIGYKIIYMIIYKIIIIEYIVPHLVEIFILFMIILIIYLIKSIINKITIWIQLKIITLEKSQISRSVLRYLFYIAPMYYKYCKEEKKLDQLEIEISDIGTEMSGHHDRIKTIEKQIDELKKKPLESSTQRELSKASEKLLEEKNHFESLFQKKMVHKEEKKSVKSGMDKIHDKACNFILINTKNKQLQS